MVSKKYGKCFGIMTGWSALALTATFASLSSAQNPPVQGTGTQGASAPAQAPTTPEDPASLISRMIARYNSARTLQGAMVSRQTARGVVVETRTELAIDGTLKLSLRQARLGKEPKNYYAVSDGQYFAYDRPEGVGGAPRFKEPQFSKGAPMTVRDLYMIVGFVIAEKSVPLDLVFSRRDDLVAIRNQWGPTFQFGGNITYRGKKASVVRGTYLPYPGAAKPGNLEMVISEEGDLMRYTEQTSFAVKIPDQNLTELVQVRTDWEVDIKINEPVEPKLFANIQ